MASDGHGRPLKLILTPGQVNDITQAPALLKGFKPTHVLADKGYDSRAFVAQIEAAGALAVIPPRSCQQPRPFDAKLYRARNAIERCFGRLKQFRRIATRYDRKVANFMAFLCLGASLAWLPA
jgi:transposase